MDIIEITRKAASRVARVALDTDPSTLVAALVATVALTTAWALGGGVHIDHDAYRTYGVSVGTETRCVSVDLVDGRPAVTWQVAR